MPLRAPTLLALAALLLCACPPAGTPSFQEVSAADGRRLLADPATVLVRLGAAWPSGERREVALVDARAPLPPEAASGGPVLVLADDPAEALRLAARLARDGIEDVAVVRGGAAAWDALATRAGETRAAGG